MSKKLALLPLIFCWCKYIFLMIKFLLKNIFHLIFEALIPWTWLMPPDIFFLKSMKNCWPQQKSTWKVVKRIIFENNNIIAFQWGFVHPNGTSGSEIRAIQMLENWKKKKLTSAKNFSHTLQIPGKFCEIAKKCVKVIFGEWKIINEINWVINEKPKFFRPTFFVHIITLKEKS